MIILQITEMDHESLEEMEIMQDLTFYVKLVPMEKVQVVVLVNLTPIILCTININSILKKRGKKGVFFCSYKEGFIVEDNVMK